MADLTETQAFSEGFGMLESGVEDEHIRLIQGQIELGSTIGMMPSLIPYTKWEFLPIPWLHKLQARRERLKEVILALNFASTDKVDNRTVNKISS